ncbi:DUF5954 family protein [Streptomyces sp. NPDC058382]|uniref:DUF5954 family protein n=1 Tax=unclassified Streptomyces TaxID=2593676 RepID=UPI00363F21B1
MSNEGVGSAGRSVVVRVPVEPVEAAIEADAFDAALRNGAVAVRGPLYGVASQRQEDGARWRVAVQITHICPQQARDALNSLLWFRAKDDAEDRPERRALLAAVTRLETECVDELTVLDTRYRVVRAEEYGGMDAHGDLELPRPTDPEPLTADGSPRAVADGLRVDADLILDPDAALSPVQAAERLSLRSLVYTGTRFPAPVLRDSARAVDSHPDVLLLPAAFQIVERSGDEPWTSGSSLHATPHGARRTLHFSLVWLEPRRRGLIPLDSNADVDAHTTVAEGTSPAIAELTVFAKAAAQLRAGRVNQIEVDGTTSRIVRTRRLLRWGPDGPEGPRPSDINTHPPEALHPRLDEDGTVHFDSAV